MKRTTKLAIGIGTALTLGLAAAVVSAHPHGYGSGRGMEQGRGYEMGYGPGPGMGRGMGPQGYGGAMADARLAYLKSELKITSGQEAAWKSFADQAKQRAEAMQALTATMQGSTQATAPERLELRNQIMKKRQEQMEKSTAAFKELYAVLTPEQKTAADQRFGAGRGHGRGHHGGFGGRFG